MKLNDEAILIAALGGLGLFLLIYIGRNAKTAGEVISSAAVDLTNGVVTGTVTATGEIVGIPKTNQTECDKAKAEGRTWDASFACPAGDFLKYVFN